MNAAKTPRRKRHDIAQTKPQFKPLTSLWIGSGSEFEWRKSRAQTGKFLHPTVVEEIKMLRLFANHRPYSTCKTWVHDCLKLRAIGVIEQTISEAVIAALLVGDAAFFDHLALAMRSVSDPKTGTDINELATLIAYEIVRERIRERMAVQRYLQGKPCDSNARKIATIGLGRAFIAARESRRAAKVPAPEPHQILEEICENAELVQFRTSEFMHKPDAALRKIRRYLKKAGLEVSDARRTQRKKPVAGQAKVKA
jgi:hypothetical protein